MNFSTIQTQTKITKI